VFLKRFARSLTIRAAKEYERLAFPDAWDATPPHDQDNAPASGDADRVREIQYKRQRE